MSSTNGSGAAENAQAETGTPVQFDVIQRQREQYATEAEAAVVTIEAKLEGIKESLKTAKDEARRLRREADQGGEQ